MLLYFKLLMQVEPIYLERTVGRDTVSIYQASLVELVTDRSLEQCFPIFHCTDSIAGLKLSFTSLTIGGVIQAVCTNRFLQFSELMKPVVENISA